MAFGKSVAVSRALKRRSEKAAAKAVSIQWFIENVANKTGLHMRARVSTATEFLKSRVVENISKPVTKTRSRGRTRVTDRSKPGEFPRADTTQLMKSIFTVKQARGKVYDGFVGTPLDYGLILETRRDRSFLKRTLQENLTWVNKILSGPIRNPNSPP